MAGDGHGQDDARERRGGEPDHPAPRNRAPDRRHRLRRRLVGARKERDRVHGAPVRAGPAGPDGVEHGLRGRESVVGMLGHAAEDDLGEPGRDVVAGEAGGRHRITDVTPDDLLRVGSRERRCPREHLEDDGAHSIEIAARIHAPAPQRLLGAHVERGPHDEARFGEVGGAVQVLHDAEIHQQRAAGDGFEEDVIGLHVPVDQPVIVRVLQGVEDRLRDLERVLGRERALGLEQVGDRAPLQVGHRIVHQPLALADEVDRHGVGVVEPRDGAGLLFEPGDGRGRPGQVGPEHFDREPPLQIGIHDLVHLGEAAAADHAHHPVLPAERLPQALDRPGVVRPGIERADLHPEKGQASRSAPWAVCGAVPQEGMAG